MKEVITIDIEGERLRTDPAYTRYYARIQETIRHEVQRATSQAAEVA